MKLSVVIPIYNMERWLAACLDSVIDPACADYEILAVNDGSADRSGEIAADYAARFPALLRVIATPNGGLGHARNTGLEAARGDYLLFLDSDDTLAPGASATVNVTPGGTPSERSFAFAFGIPQAAAPSASASSIM